jgi:rRNA maturation endonuclease Nob1
MKKCPFCAELIKEEAAVCKHCGRDLITHAESAEVRSPTRRKATERARYV